MYFVQFCDFDASRAKSTPHPCLNTSDTHFCRVSGLAIHGLIGLAILKLRPQLAQVSRPVA